MTKIDYNVNNYTMNELLAILEIDDDDINKENIIEKTNSYIKRFKNENNSNLVIFSKYSKKIIRILKKFK
jgi:hypothetical protein